MKEINSTAENIRIFRSLKSLSQQKVVDGAMINIKTFQKIEREELYADEAQLERIAKVLGVKRTCLLNFNFQHALMLFMRDYHLKQLQDYSEQDDL